MDSVIGSIFWVAPVVASGIPHPHVVIYRDGDVLTLCALTTNMNKLNMPGNILLEPGEGGLPKQSIVEVAKTLTLDAAQLGEYIGVLSQARLTQIHAGIRFVRRSFLDNE